MKFKWNDDDQKYIKLGLTALAVVILSILSNQVLHQLPLLTEGVMKFFDCLRPIFYGLVFAYVLTPALKLFEKGVFSIGRKGKKLFDRDKTKSRRFVRGTGIAVIWGLTLLVISFLLKMVIPEIISSVNGILSNRATYVNNLTSWVSTILKDNPEIMEKLISLIRTSYSDLNSLIASFSELVPSISEFLSNLSSGVFSAASSVIDLVIGIIVSIYLMGAKEKFVAQTKKTIYSVFSAKHANAITSVARSANKKFGGFFIGKIIDSAIIGILCFILLSIFRIPYSVLISCIVGITNIIPFFGPFIGAIPSAVLILLVSPIKCLYFIIIIIVLQQFDGNILGPKILGNSIGISSFWVMFSILLFGGMFGFWGLLCGVPVFAVIYDIVSEFLNRRLKNKQLSTVTADYRHLNRVDAETGEIINNEEKEDSKDVLENRQD